MYTEWSHNLPYNISSKQSKIKIKCDRPDKVTAVLTEDRLSKDIHMALAKFLTTPSILAGFQCLTICI